MNEAEQTELIKALEDRHERHLRFLESLLSLDHAFAALPLEGGTGPLLAAVTAHLNSVLNLQTVGFYLVNPADFSQELAFCDPPAQEPALMLETDRAIESGVFGWALRRNRAFVQLADENRQLVLHPLTTPRSTIGMLAALAHETKESRSIAVGEVSSSSTTLRLLALVLEPATEVQPVAVGKGDIHDGRVEERGGCQGSRFRARGGAASGEAFLFQNSEQEIPRGPIVVDHQDNAHIHHHGRKFGGHSGRAGIHDHRLTHVRLRKGDRQTTSPLIPIRARLCLEIASILPRNQP